MGSGRCHLRRGLEEVETLKDDAQKIDLVEELAKLLRKRLGEQFIGQPVTEETCRELASVYAETFSGILDKKVECNVVAIDDVADRVDMQLLIPVDIPSGEG